MSVCKKLYICYPNVPLMLVLVHNESKYHTTDCKIIHNNCYLSRLMGKPTICIGENKDADQLRSNCEADQRLCFRYSVSTVPLLLKSVISSF